MSKPENHPGANYPVYRFEGLEKLLTSIGDPLSAQHLNGKHPELWLESAQQFKNRVSKMINDALVTEKTVLIASYWENVVLLHALYVDGKDLDQVDETWKPTKSGGIILVKEKDTIKGWEYNPQFEIIS